MKAIQSRFATLLLLAFAVVALTTTGCGKKQTDVESDPGAGSNMPAETLPDPTFDNSGDATGGSDVNADDLGRNGANVEMTDVFFDYDKFDLDAGDREALAQNARALRDNASMRILIEGHCDERGTVQYNLALGEKRAKQVRDYLVSLGIAESRMDVVSYGKERPFASGANEAAWSQNRRAHFVVR